MKTPANILVVVDPTVDRDFVLDRAKLIAKATGAAVTLFINNANALNQQSFAYEGIDPDFFKKQHDLFVDHNQQILEEAQKDFAAEKIPTSLVFREQHNLAESIIDQATAMGADLVIKSTHHHNLIKRSLITNTDWRLIRKCQPPLLLVKPNAWHKAGSVVTAVDPLHGKAEQSQLDHLLLEATEELCNKLGFTPWVFHSYYPFVSSLFGLGAGIREELDRIRSHHEEKLKQLLSNHRIPADNYQLSEGELVPKLIKYLQSVSANLLVIGALSRNVIERAIVGDTAEKILEDCPCDVLVIKSARKK